MIFACLGPKPDVLRSLQEKLGEDWRLANDYKTEGAIKGEITYIKNRANFVKYTSRDNPDYFVFEVAYLDDQDDKGYDVIGCTYNYAYNDYSTDDFGAHFYFDMLTFYWWNSTQELFHENN